MGLERLGGEPRVVGRHGVAELTDSELLVPFVVGDELLPHDVAPLERGDDERVHIADGDTVADVLGHLGEHEGGEIGVVLRGLDGLGGTLGDFDVVHHDGDPGVGGLVDQRAQGGGSTMVHDDAGDAGLYRGFHVGGLSGIVGPRVVELHAEADRVGLLLWRPWSTARSSHRRRCTGPGRSSPALCRTDSASQPSSAAVSVRAAPC